MIRTERQEKTAVVYFDRGNKLNAFDQPLIINKTKIIES